MSDRRILLIDDQFADPEDRKDSFEKNYARHLPYTILYETGCIQKGSEKVGDVEKTIESLRTHGDVDLVLLDVMFPGKGNEYLGIDILKRIREEQPVLPVIMFTSVERDDFRVFSESIENGANDFVEKGQDNLDFLNQTIEIWLEPDLHTEHSPRPLYGNSEPIRRLRLEIAKVSLNASSRLKGDPSIIITGESGTGKEAVANMIWRLGRRSKGPFQVVECVGLTETLLESELFGHVKGAFTDAKSESEGLIKQAEGGVLFLDEIGDMPLGAQAKLLRALQEKEIRKVGGVESERVDFQLIAATNKDLEKMVARGTFREDLYYRLFSGGVIHAPPLRECKEDIPLLAEMFLRCYSRTGHEAFSQSALRLLEQYHWPGNVRELGGVIMRALLSLSGSDVIYSKSIALPLNGALSENESHNEEVRFGSLLPDDPRDWPRQRIMMELRMAVDAKRKSKSVAEFMRRLYPRFSRTSTAALNDLINHLTHGPWGDPDIIEDSEAASFFEELITTYRK